MGEACRAAGPWCCPLRTGLIVATEWNGFGWSALLLAALAPIAGRRPAGRLMACLAMVAGGCGLIVYNATFSAVALVLAGLYLALTRPQDEPDGNSSDRPKP